MAQSQEMPAQRGAGMDALHDAGRRCRMLMPILVAVLVALVGGSSILHTAPGHTPDIWAHVYRIDGLVHGQVMPHPVTAQSNLQRSDDNVGGHVDWEWINYSLQCDDGYDPAVVLPDTITASDETGADVPYNNAAVNTPVVYGPQLVAFALGHVFGWAPDRTFMAAQWCMLAVYTLCMALAVWALPRWRVLAGLVMVALSGLGSTAFGISADGLTQALVIVLSCMLFRAFDRRVGVGFCAALAVLCAVVGVCKVTYVPLVALALLVPWRQRVLARRDGLAVRSWWRQACTWWCTGGVAVAVVLNAAWQSSVSWFTTTPMLVPYEDMAARRHAVLSDPKVLWQGLRSIVSSAWLGRANLGDMRNSFLLHCWWAAVVVMVAILIAATVRRCMSLGATVWWWCVAAASVGSVVLTYAALWLQYTVDISQPVDGMQIRYCCPVAMACVLCVLECCRALLGRKAPRGRNNPSCLRDMLKFHGEKTTW